jgi:hypothetical protein
MDDVISLELRLLDPAVRRNEQQLRQLLHPEFREHGSSGTVWTRDDVVRRLALEPGSVGEASDFEVIGLASDVVLLTYRITGGGGDSLRSSLWVWESNAWRLRFHQGTAMGITSGHGR